MSSAFIGPPRGSEMLAEVSNCRNDPAGRVIS